MPIKTLLTTALFALPALLWPWTQKTPVQTPPIRSQIMGWERVCFAFALNRAIVVGGWEQASSEPQNAIMAYSARDNRWDIVDVGSGGGTHTDYITVGGHDQGSSCYDEKLHAFVTPYAWAMGSQNAGMCQYDVRGNIGRNYYPTTPVGNLNGIEVCTCFDPDSNCIYYLGGTPGASNFCRYRPSENRWKILTAFPGSINNKTIAYDKIQKKVIVPGGQAYNPATNTWGSTGSLSGDVIYNELLGQCEGVSKSTCMAVTRSIVFDPFDNLHISIEGCGGGSYGSNVYTQSSSASSTKALLTFNKQSYASDPRWKSIGTAVQADPTGWARAPRILFHQGSLYLAWGEYEPANWGCEGGSRVRLAQWTGSLWQAKGRLGLGNYSDFPGLFSDGTDLYVGVDNITTFYGATATHYRVTTNGIDSLNKGPVANVRADNSSLPQIVFYKGQVHSVYFRSRAFRDYGGLGHSIWNENAKTWTPVDTNIVIAPYTVTADSHSLLYNTFSAEVKGDSIVTAYTAWPENGKPLTVEMKCYDGVSWKKFGSVSANPASQVTMYPSLAANAQKTELYVGYVRRPFLGRKNAEVIVERFNGTGWTPLGGPLNVNDSTRDAWAFRPSLAVNSTGVLYTAWTEHVWGSAPQVYVAHWNGAGWTRDFASGSSLNMDGTDGSAQNVSLTFQNDKPTVAWSEHVFGNASFRKIYVKQLDEVITAAETRSLRQDWNISVSPNPITGRAVVRIVGANGGSPLQWRVFDLRGRQMWSGTGRDPIFDARLWPNGLYIIKATSQGSSMTHKFIVQK